MPRADKKQIQLKRENEELRLRLQEAEETITAIRSGEVDALVVDGPEGERIFSLKSADHSYRVLIEEMHEGAMMLSEDGGILYANKFIEKMLGTPLEKVVGSRLDRFMDPSDYSVFQTLLRQSRQSSSHVELALKTADDSRVPAYLSINCLPLVGDPIFCLAIADLTDQKKSERILAEERLSRSIIEQSADAIIVCDDQGKVIRASQAALNLVGRNCLHESFDAAFRLNINPGASASPGEVNAFKPFSINHVISGRSLRSCEAVIEKNGVKANHLLLSAAPLLDQNGKVAGGIVNLADITEKIEFERRLKENEEWVRTLLKSIGDAVIATDEKGRVKFLNPVAEALTGWKREEAVGEPLEEIFVIVNEFTRRPVESPVAKVISCGSIVGFANHTLLIARDGREIPIKDSGAPIRDEQGAMFGVVLVFQDQTEERRAERVLAESEERLRLALAAANQGLYDLNVQTGECTVSPEYARMLGYDPAEFRETNDRWRERLHPEDREAVYRAYQEYVSGQRDEYRVEFRQRTQSGQWKWILSLGRVVSHDADGAPLRMLGTHTDITELKRTEKELLESEERFRLGFENANIGMCLVDTAGKLIRVNRQMCEIFGYSRDELEGMTVNDITHPDYRNVSPTFIRRAQNRETEHAEFEKAYIHKQGHLVWGHVSSSLIRNTNSDSMYFISHVMDITERKKVERELRESEERYRILVEISTDALLWQSSEAKIVYANPSALALFHAAKAEDLLGKSYLDFVHPDDIEESIRRGDRCRTDNTPLPWREHRLIGIDGREIHVESTGFPINYQGNHHMVGLFRDLTERKRMEEEHEKMEAQVRQSQKMEAVGRLAGGVAHDFNNMLGVIIGYSDLAILKLPAGDCVQEYLSEVKSAANRSADITRQLLAFARRQTISPKNLDLNDAIEGMLKMLRRLIGEDIDLHWKPAQNLWPVKMDPSQIDQILANLTVNARDAISGVGKITIETENEEFDLKYCESNPGFIPGKYSKLAVSDNGHGMDKETLEQLFEPFFTTKKEGEGTGLGLATVYGIVKQNNGFINVYSEPGHGTTFKIYLPSQDAEAGEIEFSGGHAEAATGTETVLLVEDEKSLLKFAKTLLEDLGYRVLAASSPQEAIQLSQRYEGEIHLLMTDVVMPEMNGRDLGMQIEAFRPGIKCLFMSGYTANVIAHRGVLNEGVHFVQKPFSREVLARKLREALS